MTVDCNMTAICQYTKYSLEQAHPRDLHIIHKMPAMKNFEKLTLGFFITQLLCIICLR